MSGLSKVIIVDPDSRAGRQVQLGFEREGVASVVLPVEGTLSLDGAIPGVVVVGGSNGEAVELVQRARAMLAERSIDVPIVSTGHGVPRAQERSDENPRQGDVVHDHRHSKSRTSVPCAPFGPVSPEIRVTRTMAGACGGRPARLVS